MHCLEMHFLLRNSEASVQCNSQISGDLFIESFLQTIIELLLCASAALLGSGGLQENTLFYVWSYSHSLVRERHK